MDSVFFSLFVIAIIPMFASVIIYFLLKTERFANYDKLAVQIFIGVIFGIIAICGTEYGINLNGAIINARDAAVLCASLVFGGLPGIIAGLFGGIERWVSVLWTNAYYTRLGCSISTILAGFIGAYVRKYLYDDEMPGFTHALVIGLVVEVIHLSMIFVTNISDVRTAFYYVEACTVPMLTVNSLAVAITVFMIRALENNDMKQRVISSVPSVSNQIQRRLFTVLTIGFVITSIVSFFIQSQASTEDINHVMAIDVMDAVNDVKTATDRFIFRELRSVRIEIEDPNGYDLRAIMAKYNISEINLINSYGIIIVSSNPVYVGYNMNTDLDTYNLIEELDDSVYYVQELRENVLGNHEMRKYGIVKTSYGYIEVGYDLEQYHDLLSETLVGLAYNRHIGETGSLIVADEDGDIVSESNGLTGNLKDYFGDVDFNDLWELKAYRQTINDEDCYYLAGHTEGYHIIGIYPVREADFAKHFSFTLSLFTSTIVFGILYLVLYASIKSSVVDNLIDVSESLGKISDGDLNTVVDVRSNKEFLSLSEDINKTVDKLKSLIAEANERIDTELGYAKEIQFSALPSVFPPYPDKDEFDIYALMDPAREVGGDFYDFYLLDNDTLLFLVADVSGKGIPASLFMMRAKTTIRTLAENDHDPAKILTQANSRLNEGNDAEMFVTAWIGFLDLKTGELTFANAGHNPPLIRQHQGEYTYLKGFNGFVLGAFDKLEYKKESIILESGDEIFLYTDGVVESVNNSYEQYGDQRLLETISRYADADAKTLCEGIRTSIDEFSEGADRFDDITELSLKFRHPSR